MGSLAKQIPGIWDGPARFQDDCIEQTLRAGEAQFQEQGAVAKQIDAHIEQQAASKQIQDDYMEQQAGEKGIDLEASRRLPKTAVPAFKRAPKATFWSAPTEAEDSGADPKAFQYNDEARYQPGAQVAHARSVPSH